VIKAKDREVLMGIPSIDGNNTEDLEDNSPNVSILTMHRKFGALLVIHNINLREYNSFDKLDQTAMSLWNYPYLR